MTAELIKPLEAFKYTGYTQDFKDWCDSMGVPHSDNAEEFYFTNRDGYIKPQCILFKNHEFGGRGTIRLYEDTRYVVYRGKSFVETLTPAEFEGVYRLVENG